MRTSTYAPPTLCVCVYNQLSCWGLGASHRALVFSQMAYSSNWGQHFVRGKTVVERSACLCPFVALHTHRHAGYASDEVAWRGGAGISRVNPVGAFLRHPPLWSKDQRDLLLPMYFTPGLIRARKYVKQSVRASYLAPMQGVRATHRVHISGSFGSWSEWSEGPWASVDVRRKQKRHKWVGTACTIAAD